MKPIQTLSRVAVIVAICCVFQSSALSQPRPLPERSIPVLYSNACATCHGPTMRGGQFKGFTPEDWKAGADDASLARAIRLGNTNLATPMPPMAGLLSEAEIRAMVVFIRETVAKARNETNVFAKPVDGEVVSSREHRFQLKSVVSAGLKTPWSVAFRPDGGLLVAELPGRLRVVEKGTLRPEPVSGTPQVFARGQGGLMEVALHPGYSSNGWIYLGFSDRGTNALGGDVGMTAIVRGRIKDNMWTDEQLIFRASPESYIATPHHFGCRIAFDGSGHVYFSIGERGQMDDAQNLKLPNGKIHRLRDDGSIPADNPFVNEPGAMKSIWTFGNRNPQGLVRHPLTGELWATEHGPRGGDELNLLLPGRNYGWPVISYGMDYNGLPVTGGLTAKDGMEQPIIYWTPSIAVCGIDFYTGDKFPKWRNNLFVTGLVSQELRRVVINGHRVTDQEVLFKNIGRVRDVADGPDGFLYVVLNQPDQIIRLEPVK